MSVMSRPTANLQETRAILAHVIRERRKNVLFYGAATIAIIVVNEFARWLALTFFAVYVLIVGFDVIRWLIVAGLGVVLAPIKIWIAIRTKDSNLIKDELLMMMATYVEFLANATLIGFAVFAYFYLFPTGITF